MSNIKKATWKTYFEIGKEELRQKKYELAIKNFKKSIKFTRTENSMTLNKIYCSISYYYLNSFEQSVDYSLDLYNSYYPSLCPLWKLIGKINYKKDKKTPKDLNNFLKIQEKLIYRKNSPNIQNHKEILRDIIYMRAVVLANIGQVRWSLFYISKIIPSNNILKTLSLEEKGFYTYLFTTRAQIYYYKGLMIESIKDINNALIISNWNYRAYILAGEIYEYFKNFNLAISMFDKAISLFPNNKIDNWEYVYTYIKIGFLRVKNQNLEAAINDFELAYKRDKFYFYENNEILRKIPQGIKNIIEVNSLIKI